MFYGIHASSNCVNLFDIIVGVDIGSEKNYLRAFEPNGIEITKKAIRFLNTLEGFKSFEEIVTNMTVPLAGKSGKHKGQSEISRRGRKRLRKILFQAALVLVRSNKEFKSIHDYFTTREKNPLKKKQSLMAVAAKLIRVCFGIINGHAGFPAPAGMGCPAGSGKEKTPAALHR